MTDLKNTNPDIAKIVTELQNTVKAIADRHGLSIVMFVAESAGTEPVHSGDLLSLKVQNASATIHNMTPPLGLVFGHILSQNKGFFQTIVMGAASGSTLGETPNGAPFGATVN